MSTASKQPQSLRLKEVARQCLSSKTLTESARSRRSLPASSLLTRKALVPDWIACARTQRALAVHQLSRDEARWRSNTPRPLRSAIHERQLGSIWQALLQPRIGSRRRSIPGDARPLRINGRHGVREEIDLDAVDSGRSSGALVRTSGTHEHVGDDFTALPVRRRWTVEHKCVEGWSEIVTWGGTAFANFAALYPEAAEAEFVNMETPDGVYHVSLDRDTMLHPQTLLAWELNGDPLTQLHGAPLRLATPLKYGIKQIKRISRIEFSNERGRDYWTERGYDWYAGL